jgi:curli production assembly/transport component CsgF
MASQLVYQPINPTFGGNPMNGTILMNKAQAQNKHKEKRPEKTYADKFRESLERSIMNKLIRQITDYANGEVDEDGNPIFVEDQLFSSGDYLIEVIISNPDSLTVQLTNSETGEVTIIEIPRFG